MKKNKFLSKLMFATLVMAASLGFTACGGDDDNSGDEPQAPGVWTTIYKVELDLSDDVLKTADVTAHIANPDGTVREEPVTKANHSWTMTGKTLPDKACVLLTFVPKTDIDVTKVYDIRFAGSITAASFKDDKQQSYKTYPHRVSLSLPGDKLSAYYPGKSFALALGVNAKGEIVSASASDFDFGVNFVF